MTYSLERLMTLEQIRGLVTADFEAVDRVIKQRLHSQVALVDQVASYIIYAGGKRLRPLLVLLAARACGHAGERHIDAAAIIEFIHTATLLHDDVVDGSSLRRGRDTANEVFGNATSVLVGDFLYSRAFQMMVDPRSHAHHAHSRGCHQCHRRGRGFAAHERPRSAYHRGPIH